TNSAVATVSVRTLPVISPIADQTTDENMAVAVAFSVSDADTSAESLTVLASSSDSNLVAGQNIVISGSGGNRTLTILPATNQFGSAFITIVVTDTDGLSATRSFSLLVTHVNHPPQFVGVPPIIAHPYQPYSYTVQVTDADPGDRLQVSAVM